LSKGERRNPIAPGLSHSGFDRLSTNGLTALILVVEIACRELVESVEGLIQSFLDYKTLSLLAALKICLNGK
jgi:hypothetical protein